MTIYFAGGCFQGLQKYLDQFPGVRATEVGYADGPDSAPTYREVCDSNGYAETVKIEYGSKEISLRELFDKYLLVIDPLPVNKQGNDRGIQYRTGIYYADQNQLSEIQVVYNEQEAKYGVKLVVELAPIQDFYSAEEYHQKYLDKNSDGYCHILQKIFYLAEEESKETLRKKIGDLSYEVTQNAVTEHPLTGEYDDFFEKDIYIDIVSGEPLFSSLDKFDFGYGWSTFSEPIEGKELKETAGRSHGIVRTEVRSVRANSHLRHIFPDGSRETDGLRYRINSTSLRFIPHDKLEEEGYGEYKKLSERQVVKASA